MVKEEQLAKLKWKQKIYRLWKEGLTTLEEFNIVSEDEIDTSAKGASGPAAVKGRYKRQPKSWLSHCLLLDPSPWEPETSEKKVHLQPQDMSCYNPCLPCQPCGPTPLANSCNEPCVRQCQSSTVAIEPPAVIVTLPGPILSSFPQNTVVGSSTSAAVGSILSCDGVPINSGCCDLSGISSRYYGRRLR
ncbi:feather keratin Cos2-3-like [Heliangelus exortis]